MGIKEYALFADVAETKNFTRSGERMGYSQSGVSHILKNLEDELGFSLFLRTKHGVSLTPNAELILPLVRNLLASNEKLEQNVNAINGIETGQITIAAFSSISIHWLPVILYEFQETYPGIEIHLKEGGTDDIAKWIEESLVDFGLFSKRNMRSLEWIPLYEDPLMAVLPKDYPIPADGHFPINEIGNQPFIISAMGVDYDIHYALQEAGISPSIHFSSKDDHAIISMVSNHLGISILPKLIVTGFEEKITALPLKPFYSRDLGIGLRSSKDLAPAAIKFIEFTKRILPTLL
ncbi:MAG: LysR family transcriptional regulator [Herbinix sp.]|nr:LysR family transcriptional regulator [Herbinix sp.]